MEGKSWSPASPQLLSSSTPLIPELAERVGEAWRCEGACPGRETWEEIGRGGVKGRDAWGEACRRDAEAASGLGRVCRGPGAGWRRGKTCGTGGQLGPEPGPEEPIALKAEERGPLPWLSPSLF